MKVQLRYVIKRKNKSDGSIRWYWSRPGHPRVRLPDDENQRISRASELNASADNDGMVNKYQKGTIAWAVDEYRNSEDFTGRSASTRRIYGRWMKLLEERQGGRHLSELNRGNVKKLIAGVDAPGNKNHLRAVLARLVEIARDHEYLQHNTTDKLGLPTAGKRDLLWSDDEEALYFKACQEERHAMALSLGMLLLLYTGQRPCDVLAMTWADYDGFIIQVEKQKKTGAKVDVKAHSVLKAALDEARRHTRGIHIVQMPDGQPWNENYFRECCAAVRKQAGITGLQNRDCRRTAVMRLYEVEATEGEIASITGHSIAQVKNILNSVYFTRTAALAASGIEKLEGRRRRHGEQKGDTKLNARPK